MKLYKVLLATGLFYLSGISSPAYAGLYSSDTNNFSKLKSSLTDFSKYRYAALVSIPLEGDSFQPLLGLAKIYANILDKDMGIAPKLYETDTLQLKNIVNFRNYAIGVIKQQNFEASDSTCAIASTFLYPSTVSGLLHLMAPDVIIIKDDPTLRNELVDVSKHFLAEDLGVLVKMCDTASSRKQIKAFKEFLEALQAEQAYIASNARLSAHNYQATIASAAEEKARHEISQKALERKAAQDKADQDMEDARQAKINEDRAARLAEKNREAQLREEAYQRGLAARTSEELRRQQQPPKTGAIRPLDLTKAMKFASCSALFTVLNDFLISHGKPTNDTLTNGGMAMATASTVYSNVDYMLNNSQTWTDKYSAGMSEHTDIQAWLEPQSQDCIAAYKSNSAEISLFRDQALTEISATARSLTRQ